MPFYTMVSCQEKSSDKFPLEISEARKIFVALQKSGTFVTHSETR
jgi:hypothetical protein